MADTLQGRVVAILIADGSDGAMVDKIKRQAEKAGAMVKLIAPKMNVTLKGGRVQAADGQLAGSPSVLFDAVASVLAPEQGEKLTRESAAVAWFADAFAHLKAIAACGGTQPILHKAGVEPDAGVLAIDDVEGFLAAARTRQWDREPKVRTLA